MFDTIVVGAGPGGAIAARQCALKGLKTLLVERAKLPRNKNCGGLIWPEAVAAIEEQVGKIPLTTYATAPLRGMYFHGPTREEFQEATILNTWRRDLDYWLTGKAVEAGAELWESTLFWGFTTEGSRIVLSLRRGGKEAKVETKVLIGADGSGSTVHRLLYPEINFYAGVTRSYRPYYKGTVDLDLDWCHKWMGPEWGPTYTPLVSKGELMATSWSGGPGENLKKGVEFFVEFLTKNYNFRGTFVYAEGCEVHAMPPNVPLVGKGNVMLVGDAAGIQRRGGEGFFGAVRSGVEAGKAAAEALASGRPAAEIYAEPMKPIGQEAKKSLANEQHRYEALLSS